VTARERLLEDRHLRDAAKALVEADFANLRADLAARSIGERAVDRVVEGASEVYEEALEVAADHKGVLAAIIGALLLGVPRNPIPDAVEDLIDARK